MKFPKSITALKVESPVRAILTLAAALAGATVVAVCATAGTYGLWADSTPVNAGIVTSGSLTLTTTEFNSVAVKGMFPGDRVQQSLTLTNGGDVRSDVAVAAAGAGAGAADYEVRVASGACPAGSAPLATPNAIGAAPSALGVFAAGQASPVCVEVLLKENASAASKGATVPFTLSFSAAQKAA